MKYFFDNIKDVSFARYYQLDIKYSMRNLLCDKMLIKTLKKWNRRFFYSNFYLNDDLGVDF